MRKSLCRKWTSAFGIRTSGLCRSAPIESAWLSCGISPSGGKKIGDTNWLGPASCAWTMRRSEACLYRPISLLMSLLLWKLAPRRKAPFQLADRCWPASLALAAASQLGAPIQTSASDADGATPEEALRELAPDSDTRSIDKQGDAHERCLCPPEDWLANRERALANGCPAWIQHVADAASVLLCHAYELSRGVECRFAGYQSQTGNPEPKEDTDLTECVIKFDWLFGAPGCSYQTGVPFKELSGACDVHCEPGRQCYCKAALLVEVPSAFARRLLRCDAPRRAAMAAAKCSDDLAAAALPHSAATALRVVAATPPSMVRLAYLRDRDFELQLPAQPPPTCTYLGQPKDDGNFTHASAEWSVPKRALLRTKVAFEWRAQRGDNTISTQVHPPPDFKSVKNSQQVPIPERFLTAKRLIDIFERICSKSLAKLGKRKPPHTLISCQLLGAPKERTVGQEDIRVLGMGNGESVEHLMIARIKDDVYVCCTDVDA